MDCIRNSASRSNSLTNSCNSSVNPIDHPLPTPRSTTPHPTTPSNNGSSSSGAVLNGFVNFEMGGAEEVDQDGAGDNPGAGGAEELRSGSGSGTDDDSSDEDEFADPFADWDNGEELTEEERRELMTLGSNYERSRAMNIRRRERLAVEMGLKATVNNILAPVGVRKPVASAPVNLRRLLRNPGYVFSCNVLLCPHK